MNFYTHHITTLTLAGMLTAGALSSQTFGQGCGGGGAMSQGPTIEMFGLPQPDSEFSIRVTGSQPNLPTVLLLGARPLPGPIDLGVIGAGPGCDLLVQSEVALSTMADPSGAANFSFFVSRQLVPVGLEFFTQGLMIDPQQGLASLTTTSGLFGFVAASVWQPYTSPQTGSQSFTCGGAANSLYTNPGGSGVEQLVSYRITNDCEFSGWMWVEDAGGTEVPMTRRRAPGFDKIFGSVDLQPGWSLWYQCTLVNTVVNRGCSASYKVLARR